MSPALNWPHFCHKLSKDRLVEIMVQIEESGFYTRDAFLDPDSVLYWKDYIEKLDAENQFQESAIGPQGYQVKNINIRSDKIFWLRSFAGTTEGIGHWLDDLRLALKNYFRIPADEIESHFSIYPTGASYEKHIDNGSGLSHRLFTFIFYLNSNWQPGDGGELVLYEPGHPDKELKQINPRSGTFVLFRSDLFHHEVLKAHKPRFTFTGWLRRHARV
jgi:SM-20-related protein